MLKFGFEKCDESELEEGNTCKDLLEKYFIVLTNSERYDRNDFNNNFIARESRMHWIPIDSV